MTQDNFRLCIETQYWQGQEEFEYWSNGEIYFSINDTVITQKGIDEEWGISESALYLLRTLEKDYHCNPKENEGLIVHGCGALLMLGCPIAIHWSVEHKGNEVQLSNFMKKTDTASVFRKYPELENATVSFEVYKKQILSFAQIVKNFFDTSKFKIFNEDYDQILYQEYWEEFNYYIKKYDLK